MQILELLGENRLYRLLKNARTTFKTCKTTFDFSTFDFLKNFNDFNDFQLFPRKPVKNPLEIFGKPEISRGKIIKYPENGKIQENRSQDAVPGRIPEAYSYGQKFGFYGVYLRREYNYLTRA